MLCILKIAADEKHHLPGRTLPCTKINSLITDLGKAPGSIAVCVSGLVTVLLSASQVCGNSLDFSPHPTSQHSIGASPPPLVTLLSETRGAQHFPWWSTGPGSVPFISCSSPMKVVSYWTQMTSNCCFLRSWEQLGCKE